MRESSFIQLIGHIERITYQSDASGYVVARFIPEGKEELLTLTGCMPGLEEGQSVRIKAKPTVHEKHGKQLLVESFVFTEPKAERAIEKYLASGLVKGIGPTYAKKIVATYGKKTLETIDENPKSLLRVSGIGKKRLKALIAGWDQHKSARKVMIFLGEHGISPTLSAKILKLYGEETIEKVTENPYRLAEHLAGVGFKKADQIAQSLGLIETSSPRIDAGILFTLSELNSSGHTCYPKEALVRRSAALLFNSDPENLNERQVALTYERIAALLDSHQLIERKFEETAHIFLPKLDSFERSVASHLQRLIKSKRAVRAFDSEKALNWLEEQLPFKLDSTQKEAIEATFNSKVHVITGGPGTGKSTLTKGILTVFGKLTSRILLAAPTGKAAKRMSQINRKKAFTIHALLEYDPRAKGFKRNQHKPLEADLIIIDEASMIDTQLMHMFLQAVPSSAMLVLVGDTDQLPSIGPGNVLKDLIASKALRVTQLTKIFRQAWASKIIKSAYQINQGHFFSFEVKPNDDLFFIEKSEAEEIQKEIIDLAAKRIPKKYGFDPITDIQVLTPMRKGIMGAEELNGKLQEAINPQSDPLWSLGKKLQLKDKVMQLRNNYDKNVYNGDIGKITEIDNLSKELFIDFDGRIVAYSFSELDEITLCYAVSIHKYQGSECPCVIIPIHTAHFKLLTRNLLYTGITRARKLVILVGTKKALAIAIHNCEVDERFTGLKFRFLMTDPIDAGFSNELFPV
jgi:exodeoxyribonuclease V alpha subunit